MQQGRRIESDRRGGCCLHKVEWELEFWGYSLACDPGVLLVTYVNKVKGTLS